VRGCETCEAKKRGKITLFFLVEFYLFIYDYMGKKKKKALLFTTVVIRGNSPNWLLQCRQGRTRGWGWLTGVQLGCDTYLVPGLFLGQS
jgi:hypothetical protein